MKVIDLFAGVGGMSLGAAKAGFSIAGAVELDSIAINSHKINFPNTQHLQYDISSLKGEDLNQAFKLSKGELTGVIGGPPCQGFSSMGKQDVNDPRNSLFLHYFRLVNELQPDFFVAENVPGLLDKKYDEVRNKAFTLVEKNFDLLPHVIINAKDVGAPTSRKRVFFIGFNKKKSSQMSSYPIFSSQKCIENKVQDALFGLPEAVDNVVNGWVQIKKGIEGTYIDALSKNIPLNVGDSLAIEKLLINSEINGMIGTKHKDEVVLRFSKVEQGSVETISRFPRLRLDGYCPTLRAGTGSDKGSYQAVRPIHPTEHRVITPREAARLQGFPDWFQFHKTKWHSFRQIGNSVSPIVAEHVMKKIYENITR